MLPDPSPEQLETWKAEQAAMAKQVIAHDTTFTSESLSQPYYVAGLDISFVKESPTAACGALSVLQMPDQTVVYEDFVSVDLSVPYIPGFLAFREHPVYEMLLTRLEARAAELRPHVILVDGNGTWHPRRCGSACHIGIKRKIPTIGVSKNILQIPGVTGKSDAMARFKESCTTPGSFLVFKDAEGAEIGALVRGKHSKVPLCVSVGDRISLQTAVQLVLCLTEKSRIPEPIRCADLHSRKLIREQKL